MALLRLFILCIAFEAAFTLECGEFSGYSNSILQTRIVNGELATLGEFPWQISMQRRVRVKAQVVGAQPVGTQNITELTEDEILDNSLWGRFLWSQLAAEKNITFEQVVIGNWPPPIPTHAPGSQTFPPIPTHPPSHRLPTHSPGSQTFPPMPPLPAFPPGGSKPGWAPPVPGQPWPPQQRPPVPSLPPRPNPLPTLPPSSSRPNPLPTLPPSSWRPNPLPTLPPQQPQPQPKPRPPIDRTQKWQHFCGGSIIDNSWILTAAHCVESMKFSYTPGTIRIVAGSLDWRNFDEQRTQVIPVDRIIVHNSWSQQSGQNDVALLHLQSPIEFVKEQEKVIVNKVCLSRVMNREHSGISTSSGWGFLSKDQRVTPDLMRRVDLPVVEHNTCRNAFSRVISVTQMQVCAGQAPRGNCMGDSGGPLVQKEGNKATQIGIVSFSIPCAVPGYPDVFTRVSKYLDWIITNTGLPF